MPRSTHHWISVGGDQLVPKITGPHRLRASGYALGEVSSALKLWSVGSTGVVYNERTGVADNAEWFNGNNADSQVLIETGYLYPAGPQDDTHMHILTMSHSDWGASQTADVEVEARNEASGVLQSALKRGVSLRGNRTNSLFLSTVRGARCASACATSVRRVGLSAPPLPT